MYRKRDTHPLIAETKWVVPEVIKDVFVGWHGSFVVSCMGGFGRVFSFFFLSLFIFRQANRGILILFVVWVVLLVLPLLSLASLQAFFVYYVCTWLCLLLVLSSILLFTYQKKYIYRDILIIAQQRWEVHPCTLEVYNRN